MFSTLLRSRRFAPLFWCQFFSAFNDNFVRNMLAMLILFRIGADRAGALVTLAIGIFILPSIVLSALGGELADSHDKALIARRLKFAEIFVQMIAAAGFLFASLPLLYTALFGLGVIAALFGPIKYGILPDHLETAELPAGNALVEAATFLAILLGLVVGGFAAEEGRSSLSVLAQLMIVALACWGASRFIPATGVAAPGLRVDPNIFRSTGRLLRDLKQDKRLWIAGIAISWFWTTGAIALSLIPVVVKARVGGGIAVETAISALFAIGIAIGSVLAAALAHGRILLLPTPVAAGFMGLFLLDLALATHSLPAATHELALGAFFESASGLRIGADFALLALSGGLFVVPIFSAAQAWAGEDRRARVVAGVNILNSIFIVAGSLTTSLLQGLAGLSEPLLLGLLGLMNLGACLLFFRTLPGNFVADALNLLFRLTYRLEVKGLENVARAGERCVIALNHVSFLDAPVVLSVLEKRPTFAIDWQIAKAWWVRPFLGIGRCVPLDPSKPLGTRGLIRDVEAGEPLIIFPEGRITVTGGLMKVYDGAAMIADKADAMVVPVRLEGLERTPFSRLSKTQVRRALFPKVRITFLAPRRLDLDPAVRGRARRQAAGAALYDVMSDLVFATTPVDMTLFEAMKSAVTRTGAGRTILEDPIVGGLSGRRVLLGAAVLARRIEALSDPGEALGLMLPNAVGTAVTFFAVQQAGRVAAMLNFTAGTKNIIAACACAQVRTVLTSRAFVDKASLGPIVAELSSHARVVYLEDVRAGLTRADKLRGLMDRGRPLVARQAEDPAVILFTSGSEGLPKGVVHASRSLMANVAQINARFDISAQDIVFNVLPLFHAFGLTGGMLLPMLTGMKCYLYPSPLHYRQIPELVYGINATVLFGTDTFLAGYARTANPYDFRSLRYVVAGAEPVRAETRRKYMEMFGLRILEGYGVTECAPVVAVNSMMFNRTGTVGRLLPGIAHRIEPVPGIAEGGRLFVKGPNIMLGYLRADDPGVLEAPTLGWYDTGDIVEIDRQGFVTIRGRAKRFAKIAGEMVSLAAVEALCGDIWPDMPLAIVALPDPRKGERLVLVTADELTRSTLHAAMKARGASDLMVPAQVLRVDTLPQLGSGKTDYIELARLARDRAGLETVA